MTPVLVDEEATRVLVVTEVEVRRLLLVVVSVW